MSDNVTVKQMRRNCLILRHAATHHNVKEILDEYLSGFFIEGEAFPLSLEVNVEAMRGAFYGAIVGKVAFNLSVSKRPASRGKQVETGNTEQCQEVTAKPFLKNDIKVGPSPQKTSLPTFSSFRLVLSASPELRSTTCPVI